MQSLVLSYAQDLRLLYNAEREKREQLAQTNARLNTIVAALLTTSTAGLPTHFEPADLASTFQIYLRGVAEAHGWEAGLEYQETGFDHTEVKSSPTNQALAVLIFRFMQAILLDIPNYTKIVKVLVKLEQGSQLSLSVQYWEDAGAYISPSSVAAPEVLSVAEQHVPQPAVSKKNELDANARTGDNKYVSTYSTYEANLEALRQQVKLLGGSFRFEPQHEAASATITIII